MSGDVWEGWEASEEREEEERSQGRFLPSNDEMMPEDVEGTIWFQKEPPEGGLATVAGGLTVVTPKGRKVIVGVHPDSVSSQEEREAIAAKADEIMDDIEKQQEHMAHVHSWMGHLIGAVGKAMSGEDASLLWKVASMLYDYEKAVKMAEGKGYSPRQWDLKSLLDLLPNFDELEEIEEEGDEHE